MSMNRIDRSEFLHGAMRWLLGGALGISALLLWKRGALVAACDGGCAACAQYAQCGKKERAKR